MAEERRIQLVTEVDTTGAREGLQEIGREAGAMAANVSRSGQQAERAVSEIGSGAGAAAGRVEVAQRRLIQSIERTTAQMQAGSRTSAEYFETLARQRGVDANVLTPYLNQLRAVEQAQRAAGQSAAQTANAMRQVPGQITDIVTSLQGGQAPLTVLLQQGGQLRDSFGGAGAALRALGAQLMGLINPFTVAAAGAAALGYAYVEGAKEARAYNTAIATTGNAAGTSADQLADAARQVSQFIGSQREAAEVIASLAATGRVAGDEMARFTIVAIKAQRDLGRDVKTTADEFAALGKAPAQALAELSEKYRHITASTYAQVQALVQQGRATEAATLAQQAHAEGIERQRARVVEALSDWERGWLKIKSAIGSATDASIDWVLNVSREETAQQEINSLLVERERLEKNLDLARGRGDSLLARRTVAALEQNKAEINAARDRAQKDKDRAQAEGLATAADQLRIQIQKESVNLLSREEQRTNALNAARTEARRLGLNEAETLQYLAIVRKRYSDVDEDAKRKGIEAAKKVEEQLKREAAAIADMSGLTSSFADDWKLLTALYAKGAISIEQLTKAQGDLLAKQPAIKAAADQEIAARKEMAEFNKRYSEALDSIGGMYAKTIKAAEDEAANNEKLALTYGMTRSAIEQLEITRLEEQLAQRASLGLTLEEIAYLEQLIAAKKRNAAAYVRIEVGDANKKALDELNQFLDPGRAQSFGEALRESFGRAGDALTKLTASLDGFGRRQAEIAKHRETAEKNRGQPGYDELKYLREISELNRRETKNRLAGYGDMTAAAAGFFGEQSKGYQALMAMSKVFHAAELAMTLAELVPKGIAAVLTQGTGDPYTAFGRMAAMAAIVTGLGVAIGSVSGGGPSLSESRQKSQGTGTVLGSDAKSESISKSLDMIERATFQDLAISTSMLNSLRNIESNIGNFAALLVRDSGVTGEFGSELNKKVFDSKAIGVTGAALGGLGGAMAGTYIGMGTSQIGMLLGGPLGLALGAVLGAVIGKTFIGKALGSVFGGKQTVEDTGFTINPTTMAGVLGGGLNAMQYADIKKDGGWFRSDKYSTKTASLGTEGNRQIAAVLESLYGAVFEAGKMLDINADAFAASLNSFVVDIGKVSLKGLSDDEIEKELQAVFSKLGDDLARYGVAGLEQFQKVGEGYLETLTRVSADYQTVTAVTQALGLAFNAVGYGSIAARERLIDFAGGLDEFTSGAEKFLADFYTDQERADALRARITPTLNQFGIKTGTEDAVQQFRNVVKGLDLTTSAGAQAYATLMQIAPAFKQIADLDAERFEERAELQEEYDKLTMSSAQLLAKQRDALHESNRALFDQVQAATKAKEAQDQAKTSLGNFLSQMKSFATTATGLNKNLVLGSMSVLTPEQQYAEARRQFEETRRLAATGDAAAQGNLQAIEQTFLQLSQKINGGDAQYASDLATVMRANDELAKWANNSVDVAQASLDALNNQVASLNDISSILSTIAQGVQFLPAALSGQSAPNFAPVPSPIDYSRMGTLDMAPLVAEVKALREEVKSLRADQQKQTGDLIQANGVSAREVVEGVVEGVSQAVTDGAYASVYSRRDIK